MINSGTRRIPSRSKQLRMAAGAGPLSTTMNKMVNNWFPHHEAASAVGLANCGTPLGGAISGPIVGLMAVTVGWRVSFVVIGALGFVWLLFWLARRR